MPILITGASGYLGSHITRQLVAAGKAVRGLIRQPQRAQKEGRLKGLPVEWVTGDVTDPASLAPAFQDVTTVIHTVAIAIEKGGRTYEEINYQGTVNVVEAAKSSGVQRLINTCQLGASAHLPYRFLASKGKAQDYVAQSGLAWTAFRPSVIWGPEDEFANTFARLAPFTPLIFPSIGGEDAKFQPIWVEDVAACFVKALDDPATIGKEYEIGGPEVLTLAEIERRTLQAIGAKRLMIPFPLPILRVVVGLMEALLPAPPVTHSLLDLLSVSNVTTSNAIGGFVEQPRPFTVENVAPYMRTFRVGETLAQYLGR
jgi:uncharacterized protein YbjT (DUF2867 family)